MVDPPGWSLPHWTDESDTAFSTPHQIATSILSLTAPGTSILHGPAAASLARSTNHHGHFLTTSSPHKYGFFACIPDPTESISSALDELIYALDTLHADGVTLFTRYGKGNHYLGHPDFLPLWAELEKHKAVVFVHPTAPAHAEPVNPRLPPPFLDFPHETARAAMDMIVNNVVRDHPSCKIILSHAGGTLPYLISRAAVLLPDCSPLTKTTEEMMEEARSFYFDIALSGNAYTLPLLMQFAKKGHVLFGSDFPFAPPKSIGVMTAGWEEFAKTLNGQEMWEVERGGAEVLFPRLKDGTGNGARAEAEGKVNPVQVDDVRTSGRMEIVT